MPKSTVIAGIGGYLPRKIVTNEALAQRVDTSDAWIKERTGIAQRHIAADGETTADLAKEATLIALKDACIAAAEIDLIIVATTTPDNTFPSTASKLQALIGATSAAAFDIQAVCTGFVYALCTADMYIKQGMAKTVLVVGAETLSRIVDWNDRNTCILFGDGAGAVILRAEEGSERGILGSALYSDGTLRDILYVDGGPGSTATTGVIKMEGKEVFKHAISKVSDASLNLLQKHKISPASVKWVVPHQANIRIMEGICKRLELPLERLISCVAQHANTSAASIPLALYTAKQQGKFTKGDTMLLQGIGGGLTWGITLLKW